MRQLLSAALVAAFALTLGGCGQYQTTAATIQQAQQESNDLQATRAVGFPAINNYFERRELKLIDEERDRGGPTVTYRQDMYGRLHKVCDSLGYPMPYSTQFTSPTAVQYWSDNGQKSGYASYGHEPLPQADPNSLYSPPEAAGTWIACVKPHSSDFSIIYSEPDVVAYPVGFPVNPNS